MKTEFIILMAVAGGFGLVGFSMTIASFVQVSRNGGWSHAMKRTADGRWPRVRWVMLTGALLSTAFLVIVTGLGILEMMSGGWRS